MEEKIGVVAVVVEDFDKTDREYIVGRLGIPFKDRGTAVISVVMSAAAEKINALSGKLGMIEGVRSKVLFR